MHCNLSCLMQCPWLCDIYMQRIMSVVFGILKSWICCAKYNCHDSHGGGGGCCRVNWEFNVQCNLAGRFYMSN